MKAATALTASPLEAESARLRAIAQSPIGTGDFREVTSLFSQSLRSLPFPVAARLSMPVPAPSREPAAPPPPATKKGKKRDAPVAEAPVDPSMRGSPAIAPSPAAKKGKTRPGPRAVRKSNRVATAVPPTPAPATPAPQRAVVVEFAAGSGYAVLQALLHTDPNTTPTLLPGDFPTSAPYYIVRTTVRIFCLRFLRCFVEFLPFQCDSCARLRLVCLVWPSYGATETKCTECEEGKRPCTHFRLFLFEGVLRSESPLLFGPPVSLTRPSPV